MKELAPPFLLSFFAFAGSAQPPPEVNPAGLNQNLQALSAFGKDEWGRPNRGAQ